MSSPAVKLLASRLAGAPGPVLKRPGPVKRSGPIAPGGPFVPPHHVGGGPIAPRAPGWGDPLAKEPVFRSPGAGKRPSFGVKPQPGGGGGSVRQPYGGSFQTQPYRF